MATCSNEIQLEELSQSPETEERGQRQTDRTREVAETTSRVEAFPGVSVTDERDERRQSTEACTRRALGVVKLILSTIVCLALLFCLVASKISVIVISQDLTELTKGTADVSNGRAGLINDTTRQFPKVFDQRRRLSLLMLLLIFVIPYVVTFLRCLWVSGFLTTLARGLCCKCEVSQSEGRHDVIKTFFCGFISSVAEVLGLWLLVVEVYPQVSGVTAVLLGTLVFTNYSIWNFVPVLRRFVCRERAENRGSLAPALCGTLAFALSIIGLSLIATFASKMSDDVLFVQLGSFSFLVVFLVVVLSFAWNPEVVKRQLSRTPATQGNVSENNWIDVDSRWKSAMFTSLVKIILSPLVLYIIGLVRTGDAVYIRAVLEEGSALREHPLFGYFILNVMTSFFAYFLMWMATALDMTFKICKKSISGAFFPISFATLFSSIVMFHPGCQTLLPAYQCADMKEESTVVMAFAFAALSVSNFILVCMSLAFNETPKFIKEKQLFWLPTYNGVLAEQWMFMNVRTEKNDPSHKPNFLQRNECEIYICTTMYNESEEEMRQLLKSIKNVKDNRDDQSPQYHSHIWLDGAFDVKRMSTPLNANAQRLVALMKEVFGDIGFRKYVTPYGFQLQWFFPRQELTRCSSMVVVLHFKDNRKVKNKKRWSQIMYMSYIINHLSETPTRDMGNDCKQKLEKTFILATDADVKFSHESVDALFDVLLRDTSSSVGAVCGRTHPKGPTLNPIVSYQIFDYAIGHWLQKAANHVLGTVLCAPGCFSVYRLSALKEVLDEYGRDVTSGFEFLYKDMGEDRWLCTLLECIPYNSNDD